MVRNGKIVVTDSGKRGVRTTGKTATFNTNGECEECCGCINCADATPYQYEAVFSGLTMCCWNVGGPPGAKYIEDLTNYINGTHILTRVSWNPCIWRAPTIKLTLYSYENADCTGALLGTFDEEFTIAMTKYSGYAELRVVEGSTDVFYGTQTTDECGDGFYIDNDYVIGDCSYSHRAYGGNATLTPV